MMQIPVEDPRKHFDQRSYTRAIVPGSLPDQVKRYTSIKFRPDRLRFSVSRVHENNVTGPWRVGAVHLDGWRVLKSGNPSKNQGQRYSDYYDMTHGAHQRPAPDDVVAYINIVLDSINSEG